MVGDGRKDSLVRDRWAEAAGVHFAKSILRSRGWLVAAIVMGPSWCVAAVVVLLWATSDAKALFAASAIPYMVVVIGLLVVWKLQKGSIPEQMLRGLNRVGIEVTDRPDTGSVDRFISWAAANKVTATQLELAWQSRAKSPQ